MIRLRWFSISVLLGVLAWPAVSVGQAVVAGDQSPTGLEEIVVTAQRRSESQKVVPISLSVISPQQVVDLDIQTLNDIQILSPNVTFDTAYAFPEIYIRGVGSAITNAGLEPAVAFYTDGGYSPGGLGTISDLFDIGSIEILKGAQGTLWGRNATGGVVLVNTADPVMGETSLNFTGEYGDFHHSLLEGVANLPLTDTLAIRLAARQYNQDGYVNNLSFGNKLGARWSTTLRAKIKWQPTDQFSAVLAFGSTRVSDGSDALAERAAAPYCLACVLGLATPVRGFYNADDDRAQTPFESHGYLSTLHLNYQGGAFEINSVTSYRYDNATVLIDTGLAPVSLFNYYGERSGDKIFDEEFQALSHFSGMFNGMIGYSYVHGNGSTNDGLQGLVYAPLLAATGATPFEYNTSITNSYAGFAELYVTPVEKLKVTLGARYTVDDRRLIGQDNAAALLALAPPGQTALFGETARFSKMTPRAVVAYAFDAVNVYASWNRGFKAGGFSTPTFSTPTVVQPETIDSYEVGAKYESADRRAKINLATFFYNYTNMQVTVTDFYGGGTITTNAGKSRGYGTEADGSYKATSWLNVFASAAYLDAKYLSYPNASIVLPTPTGLTGGVANLAGTPLPHAPKFTGSLSFNLDVPVSQDWIANLTTAARFTTRYDFYPDASGPLGYDYQPGFTVVNMSGYIEPNAVKPDFGLKNYKIGFYVDNVVGTKYYTVRSTTAPFGIYDTVAPPRTFGLRVSAGF